MLSKFFNKGICQRSISKVQKTILINRGMFKYNHRLFSELKLDQEESDPDFQSKSKIQKQTQDDSEPIDYEISEDVTVHEIQYDSELNNEQLVAQISKSIQDSNPEAPQCGYSRLMVELLNFYGVEEYSFVNVLEFPELRAAIKEATQWMTFPQLYRKGEFIGGSDIAYQLHQDDKLRVALIDGEHCK